MDFAKQAIAEPMLTTASLAARQDFTLGGVIVSPSTRTLRGPDGKTDIEPRVMQVLVVLADAAGQVVARETLFQRCWGDVYVGDDSLNRAVGALRRAATAVGGRFDVQTIPKTGYRLTVTKGYSGLAANPDQGPLGLTRRQLAGGAVALSAAAGLSGWAATMSGGDRRFDGLLRQAKDEIRKSNSDENTVRKLEQAVALRPDSAKAWGLLAYVKSVATLGASPNEMSGAVDRAERIARKALALDPREPNALLAMVELQGSSLDWATRDNRLRQIIAIDPENLGAIGELVLMLQAAGLSRESWTWNERALALEPLDPAILGKRALKLWIAGRVPDADKVIDQARALRPSDPGLWGAQFLILALTGRARAAAAMRDADPARLGPPEEVEVWRPSLVALERPTVSNVAEARAACFKGARIGAQLGGDAVMILAALGQVDAAFEVANGFLLSRGSVVPRGRTPFRSELNPAAWRINTQWLFTPPAAVMRADPRFLPLCEGVGLVEYWRKRGLEPDFLRQRT